MSNFGCAQFLGDVSYNAVDGGWNRVGVIQRAIGRTSEDYTRGNADERRPDTWFRRM
jgi:hypothetical protein